MSHLSQDKWPGSKTSGSDHLRKNYLSAEAAKKEFHPHFWGKTKKTCGGFLERFVDLDFVFDFGARYSNQTKPNPRLEENVCIGKFKSRHGRERRKIQKENNEKEREKKEKHNKKTLEY